ncbi:MAG: 2'-5' RNA ligase family protein [Crocinitomicaceae bacterium]|nr:2'-5' RNA ligase family protein [Crocinitomicaceae bacterium]
MSDTQKEYLKQYLIVINPSKDISSDVTNFKEKFRSKFGKAKYLDLWPHITLSLFTAREELEFELKEKLQSYAQQKTPFAVQIDKFNCFKKSGVIYLQPETEIITQFQREIPEILKQQIGIEEKHVLMTSQPHLTITRSKQKKQFQEAWDYYQNIYYHKAFVVRKMVVYRRESNNYAPWGACFKIALGG